MNSEENSEKIQNIVQANNVGKAGNMIQMANKDFNSKSPIIISNLNHPNINYNLNNNFANSNNSESRGIKQNSKSENQNLNQPTQNIINNTLNPDNKNIDQRISKFSKSQQSLIGEVVFDDQKMQNIKGNFQNYLE